MLLLLKPASATVAASSILEVEVEGRRVRLLLMWAVPLLLLGCGETGYDPPEQAEPFDTVTAVPGDTLPVPGMGEPDS